jgi:hypothetical protein
MRLVLGSLLAAGALVSGSGVALADPPQPPYNAVTTWADAEVRTCEALSCPVHHVIPAGENVVAICWTRGQMVYDHGIANNIWIMVGLNTRGDRYLASAIYFKGNERGNVPYEQDCGPY